ncbi:MAG: 3D domain-containing protein [Kiritimatiellae bacterium]|nr:3D domain-containing protein [Kiritimatiellia bacterium]
MILSPARGGSGPPGGVLLRCGLCLALLLTSAGCCLRDVRWQPVRPPRGAPYREEALKTTGYCPCGQCCNWRRNWLFRPVIAAGANRGKPKAVGITASGARAKPGTIAADTSLFPFGTIMYVPGYGYGRVEDVGGDIKGHHIDLFFRAHRRAMEWGVQRKKVRVWRPS